MLSFLYWRDTVANVSLSAKAVKHVALLEIYTVLSANVSDVVCDFAGDYSFTYVAFQPSLIQFSKVKAGSSGIRLFGKLCILLSLTPVPQLHYFNYLYLQNNHK